MSQTGIKEIGFVTTWQPDMPYLLGASVTPQDIDSEAVDLPQYWFVCTRPGASQLTPPDWTNVPGTTVLDGSVIWLNYGIYPV